jgi:hypothetical protein
MRVKSPTKSFHNIIILVIFAIGLFVIYRYVKNLEYELKITNATVSDLSKKYDNLELNHHQPVINKVPITLPKVDEIVIDNDEEDTESIQSNDITNMLKKVMMHNVSDDDFVDNIMNMINEEEREGNDSQIEIIEVDDKNEEALEDESVQVKEEVIVEEPVQITNNNQDGVKIMDIDTHKGGDTNSNKLSESTLMSKTNEQLKTLLKDKGLSVKGQKSELVKRLLEN